MRDLDLNVLTEVSDSDHLNIAILGEFEFLSGTQNLWAGPAGNQLIWDAKTWTALGDVGQIDKIGEGQGLADSRTTVSLNVTSESIDTVDVEDSRGRTATLTLLLMSDQGSVIGPIEFRTTMGAVSIEAAASTDEHGKKLVNERLSLELLNESASLESSHFVRMTYEAGLRIDPNDHGLEFVSDPEIGNVGLHTGGGRPGHNPRTPGDGRTVIP